MTTHFLALLLGTLLDRIVGDPDWLWRRFPHPVVWIGQAIGWMDRRFNREDLSFAARRRNGIVAMLVLLAGAVVAGLVLHALFTRLGVAGTVLEAVVVGILLAQKSMAEHVRRVVEALSSGGLAAGRSAVSMIVGRDPDQLDEAGVCRAAIESLAENASDGIVAPWLFYLVFGLPGLLAYKVLNTADSMIGHMSERHRAFGRAAARLDDLANLVPARLNAFAFAALAPTLPGSRGFAYAWAIARRDAGLHRSPNAGWPEAAAAAALGLAFGGPRRYGALVVDAPLLHGEGRLEATPADIVRSITLLRRLSNLLIAVALLLFLLSLAS
ncbi:cobalamin biosynthesis protein CobD [Aureimonas sp. SA4125]|uniref:adenosylcobinamide-phosphate synthase CbiB n=1 Tax=Aureimonas sp. SA4125 TaxID=2826993 RepID=UPI001CC43624|nr:adenosylcobinamide-phosphate synthase CbiB [Aureimonas sp. SA4125]BDA82597.1 cobalamin biosynthesis protein CobD [Aureimonas sp. SA4125]